MTKDIFKKLIELACATLRLSHTDVQNKYSAYPICIMEYIKKGERKNIIEVQFDDEQASFSIIFDKHSNCYLIALHPQDNGDAEPIISYLIDTYDYDFIKQWWLLSNCYLKVKELEGKVVFNFLY